MAIDRHFVLVGMVGVFLLQLAQIFRPAALAVIGVGRVHQCRAFAEELLGVGRPERPQQRGHAQHEEDDNDRGVIEELLDATTAVLPLQLGAHEPAHEGRWTLPADGRQPRIFVLPATAV
jgi:hypothetical protein